MCLRWRGLLSNQLHTLVSEATVLLLPELVEREPTSLPPCRIRKAKTKCSSLTLESSGTTKKKVVTMKMNSRSLTLPVSLNSILRWMSAARASLSKITCSPKTLEMSAHPMTNTILLITDLTNTMR